jgi:hypothetical protein
VTARQEQASGRYAYETGQEGQEIFQDVTAEVTIAYRHEESVFFDYNREPLIPHQLSTEGPALAVGDVNGDGLDDLYAGGAKWQPGRLLVQGADGSFRSVGDPAFAADSIAEDVDAAFFDADGDGDPDLYVVSGGNEFWGTHQPLRDRLYLNDGRGGFRRSREALPEFFENGSCVAPADVDRDGDQDLFVGTRVVARRYGEIPRSYLLENDGTGRFRDVTADRAPDLVHAGMVSSAVWTDYDGDGAVDLIVAGEWMPVRVFRQEAGRLVERTEQAGLGGTEGWWNSVTAVDLRGNGRTDLILGNLGLNSYVRASDGRPVRLYVHDFAGNGDLQQVLTFYKDAESYPLANRDELIRAVPALRDKFPTYTAFGAARIADLFPRSALRRAEVREARTLASAVALNRGDGSFELRPLPPEAQFAPIYAALPGDFDRDGRADVVIGGNLHGVPPIRGRYDASYGLLLRGDGAGGLAAVDLEAGGLVIAGQVRDLELLRAAGGGRLLVVARNGDALQLIRPVRLDAAQPVVSGSTR